MAPGPNLVATSDAPPRGDLAGGCRRSPTVAPRWRGRGVEHPTSARSTVPQDRPTRPVPLPPEVVAAVADAAAAGTPEAELLERLESALRLLPPAERRAVLTAHADDE